MSSPVESNLTVEKVYEAVRRMQHEHPRHFLILCNSADYATISIGIERMDLDPEDVIVEVRAHSFAKQGHCFLMRHPDDFEWRARFDVEWRARLGLAAVEDTSSPI